MGMQGERRKSGWVGWLVMGLGILLAVRTGANIYRLWKAGSQVTEAKQELAAAEAENARLKEQVKEVERPEFLEKEAREKLSLGKEGEVVVVLPDDGISAGSTSTSTKVSEGQTAVWRKWWNLYIKL